MTTMNRRTRLVTVTSLAACTALGLSAPVASAMTNPTRPASASAVTDTVATDASAAEAAPTKVKNADQIPKTGVGEGWTAATSKRDGKGALLLVAPSGQTYRVATVGTSEAVLAVSRDGEHIITSGDGKGAPRIWNTRTGTVGGTLPAGGSYAFGPNDELVGVTGPGVFTRFSITGTVLSRETVDKELYHPVLSPDGRHVAVETDDGIEVHETAHFHGTTAHALTKPKGMASCTIKGWANDLTITSACTGSKQNEVYAQASDGSRTTPMTQGVQPGKESAMGWTDAVDTPRGRLAVPTAGEAPDLPEKLFFVNGAKVSGTLDLKGFNPNAGDFTGSMTVDSINRSSVMVSTPPLGYESSNWSMGRYDLATSKFVYLVGHHSQFGGTPTSWETIDARH